VERLCVFADCVDFDAPETAVPLFVAGTISQRVLISEFGADVLEVNRHLVDLGREEGSPACFFGQPLQDFVVLGADIPKKPLVFVLMA
jgi:hypothetical protein